MKLKKMKRKAKSKLKQYKKKKKIKKTTRRVKTRHYQTKKKNPSNKKKSKRSVIQELTNENNRLINQISDYVNREKKFQPILEDLPLSYNQTRLVLMVRDPFWVYAYWDISKEKEKEIKLYKQKYKGMVKSILRVYDITHENMSRDVPKNYFDIDVPLEIGQWYIYLGNPDHKFTVDLGLINKNKNFYLITWSNTVTIPRNEPSTIIDSKWDDTDNIFNEIVSFPNPSKNTYPMINIKRT